MVVMFAVDTSFVVRCMRFLFDNSKYYHMNIKKFVIYNFAAIFYILAVIVMLIVGLSIIITIPGAIFFNWPIDWWLFTVCILWLCGAIVPFILSGEKIFSKLKDAWDFKIVYPEE